MRVIVDSKERRTMALSMVKNIRAEDCPLSVTIEPYIEDHSKEQRGIFHALCREMSKSTGYTEGEIKDYVKQDVLGTREIVIGEKTKTVTSSSEYDENGKKRDKLSYSELIEGIYRIAAEAGIQL